VDQLLKKKAEEGVGIPLSFIIIYYSLLLLLSTLLPSPTGGALHPAMARPCAVQRQRVACDIEAAYPVARQHQGNRNASGGQHTSLAHTTFGYS
jgi:hypothetical protein